MGGSIPAPIRRRSILLLSLASILAVAWLAHRAWSAGFDLSRFAATFIGLDWKWIGASLSLLLLTYVGRALRWEVMLKPLCPSPNRLNVLSATIIGFTAILLFGRAGELVRPYLIAVKEKLPLPSQLAAWVIERIYDLLVVLALFGIALANVNRPAEEIGPNVQQLLKLGGEVVAVACVVALGLLVGFRRYSRSIRDGVVRRLRFLPSPLYARIDRMSETFAQGMEVTQRGEVVIQLTFYTALEWMLIAGCYYCLFKGFPGTGGFEWNEVLLFLGFVSFGSIVQVPGVGGGLQLASVVILTEFFWLPLEAATSLAILLWLITSVSVLPLGVAFALREGLTWRKLKELEEDSERASLA